MPATLLSLRALFPHARRAVFFDHASHTPPSDTARRLLDQLAARFQELDPTIEAESFALVGELKKQFARIIHARAREISWLPNTTTGINQVLLGLDLRAGEKILLPEVEFPALVYPCLYLASRLGLKVEFLPCPDGFLTADTLRRALKRGKAAMLATSWVQYHNGYRYDLDQLTELAHRHGVFVLVDAIQGVGAVPLNVRRTGGGVDALACGGQKWLLCQMGSGFLYLNPQPVRQVRPPSIGWLTADWDYTFSQLQRHDRPLYADGRRWEGGTYSYYCLRLAQAGLAIITAAGVRRTFRHVTSLLDELICLLENSVYTISSALDPAHRSAILSFSGPEIESLHRYLTAGGFLVSLREDNIRVSPHLYNTATEMRRFIAAIKKYSRHHAGKSGLI